MLAASPTDVYGGRFDEAAATRLLWRAGFGPRRGEAADLAKLGLDGAVASLTRPSGRAQLIGPEPKGADGQPLDPIDVWGDAHCWWLDRMVRSTQPLIERMTLVWHSWFATSIEAVTAQMMLNQNAMMRSHALGNFHDLLVDVTQDPAMLVWLNGAGSTLDSPNENYGREMLELFTLGAGRGYTEHDVHENALALTGFTNDWTSDNQAVNFRYDPALHDNRVKTIFGQRGRFDWKDSCRLAVTHATHPSFMVQKLWGYFIGAAIPARSARQLEAAYVASGFEVRPVMEAILRHPLFYEGPRLVLPPAVFVAGMLRALDIGVQSDAWSWICEQAGQLLFDPPNVSGWDYASWLDTARWSARLSAVNLALENLSITDDKHYPADETPQQALDKALAFWGRPVLSAPTTKNLLAYGHQVQRDARADWEQGEYRVLRQNALRALIPLTPDWQTA